MAERIPLSALHRSTGELIDRTLRGESFELTKHGRVVALLGPAGNVAPEPKRIRTRSSHGLDANLDESRARLEGPLTTESLTIGGTTGTSSVASASSAPMQVEVTDASHPSRRPVASNTPLTAQQQRDQLLNNLGGKKR